MLLQLSIKDIVLIDRLKLDFDKGFSVFTGETGAGKSIILDCLMFALGVRASTNLIRSGAETGQVAASFNIAELPFVADLLIENGFASEDVVIFKRICSKDGRNRAYINDQPVSLAFMRNIGQYLAEIHGQHADRAFLDKAAHLRCLDEFADLRGDLKQLSKLYSSWQALKADLIQQDIELAGLKKEQEYLQAAAAELAHLNVLVGEEEELSLRRATLMRYEKMASDINQANGILNQHNSPADILADLLRLLERKKEQMPEYIGPIIDHIDEALNCLALAQDSIAEALTETDFKPQELENLEERLFALRAASRKYKIQVDELPQLYKRIESQLLLIEQHELERNLLEKKIAALKSEYLILAQAISSNRKLAAKQLELKVAQELSALKLEHAKFILKIETDMEKPNNSGIDEAEFWVQTNPTTNPGPLMKIASGGELARFLLALKMVLAYKSSVPTLIFDEVDAGVGGAVAASIGQRLVKLSHSLQILSITHSPQVAARADSHFLITKQSVGANLELLTNVQPLAEEEAIEELARMLSANKITPEARATARILRAAS